MNSVRAACGLALLCLSALQSAPQQDQAAKEKPHSTFTFRGEPVDAGAVSLLIPSLADNLPVLLRIDLEGYAKSNHKGSSKASKRGEYLRCDPYDGGYVEYRHVGSTAGHIHVLDTRWNGGGNGTFLAVLFVRLASVTTWEDGTRRKSQALELVGCSYPRTKPEILIEGNRVIVKSEATGLTEIDLE